MRSVTLTPSSLERYATNGVQRSVTPEAFSAGTTAKVSSGYLPFQSCAEAEAVKTSAAAPARTIRRVIMVSPLVVVTPLGRLQVCNRLPCTEMTLRLRQRCRVQASPQRRTPARAWHPSRHRLRDR